MTGSTNAVSARALLRDTTTRFEVAGIATPRVDAEVLLAHALGVTRSELLASLDRAVSEATRTRVEALTARRERREPLAYVLGEWGFRRLTLSVDPRVLVPRPETEILVERCLALLDGTAEPRVLDVGTGSGAIALAIADEHPGARVTAVDASVAALEVARANAARGGLDVRFLPHDLFHGLPPGPWELVASNPPYVRADEIELLEPEVRDWEPRRALVGDGATEAIVEHAVGALAAGGALVLEVADGDAARVAGLLRAAGYREVAVTRDLADRERVVEGRRP